MLQGLDDKVRASILHVFAVADFHLTSRLYLLIKVDFIPALSFNASID